MSDEQKQFNGIQAPANYRKLCEPISQADAEKNTTAFFEEFYELRNKHGIADAYCIVKIPVKVEDVEGEIVLSMHCGNELSRESMAAWAFGYEQSQRQIRIAELLAQSKSIKGTSSRP